MNRIEKVADELLAKYRVKDIPVGVDMLARLCGIDIKVYDFGEQVSGALILLKGKPTIGINPFESKIKQRFAIAHELGHFLLHADQKEIFIDKDFTIFNESVAFSKDQQMDFEANLFASYLLTPQKALLREIKRNRFDLSSEDVASELAKVFQVTTSTIVFRLAKLELFRDLSPA